MCIGGGGAHENADKKKHVMRGGWVYLLCKYLYFSRSSLSGPRCASWLISVSVFRTDAIRYLQVKDNIITYQGIREQL